MKIKKKIEIIRRSTSTNRSCIADIDHNRRIWGMINNGSVSFYFVSNDVITDLHLTIEATEALRLVIEQLQKEMARQNFSYTFSTQGFAPKKKTLATSKKAGCGKKTKKQPLAKKKKK